LKKKKKIEIQIFFSLFMEYPWFIFQNKKIDVIC
jgi:hypothetical protein